MSHYETNLDKNDANYVPLTTLTFLKRAYEIYPNYEAVIYEDRKYTWSQVYKRTVKFKKRTILDARLFNSTETNEKNGRD